MKTYTLLLDILIVCLLLLAIRFQLSDDTITDSFTARRGVIRSMIICWQTLLVVASFCVFLRYVARNVHPETTE